MAFAGGGDLVPAVVVGRGFLGHGFAGRDALFGEELGSLVRWSGRC